jgi:proline iminopeptidase
VLIAAHYFAHGAWLEEGALLRHAGRLAGIPGTLIHGRLDLGGPLATAWALARLARRRTGGRRERRPHRQRHHPRAQARAALDAFARR